MIRRRVVFCIIVPLTILATAVLYEPVSLFVYRVKEPYFGYPVKTQGQAGLVIRNDAGGEGGFGAKRRNGRKHAGVDMRAPLGAPVYASKSGIAFSGKVPFGYGRYVMIYHPDGYQTLYGHLSNYAVHSTQKVRKGDLIGFTGKTGNASSNYIEPHLHFEVRKDGEPVDPTPLLR